jgi:hypothetical protein
VILNIRELPIKGNRYFSVVEINNVETISNDRVCMTALVDDRVLIIVQDINDTCLLLLVFRVLASAAAAALAILARVDRLHVFDADHFSVPHL